VSKRLTTRWYGGSWVVYVLAWVALIMTLRNNPDPGSVPPVAMLLYVVLFATGVAMLVFWIGALIMLAQLRAWGWFTAVLVLHLIGLGIIGMVAYAVVGPDDSMTVVTRPPIAT
jgi:hypothetical protein